MFEAILNAFRAPDLRRRILYVAGILLVFRLLAHVPVPGVDRTALAAFLGSSPMFGLLDLFCGGGLATFSVVALGVNPYINASIIMQLMTGRGPLAPGAPARGRVRPPRRSTSTPATWRSRWRSSRRTGSSRS